MPKAKLDGVRINYVQAGSGPDIVMVHGLGANLAFWSLGLPRLVRRARVTAYDLRGHGYSDMPPSGYDVGAMAEDLLLLLDYLEIDRAHLVGHSFGGGIALEVALGQPGRVARLVLAEPVTPALVALARDAPWRLRAQVRRRLEEVGVRSDAALEDGRMFLKEVAAACRNAERDRDGVVPFALWSGASRSAAAWRRLLAETSAFDEFDAPGKLAVVGLAAVRQPTLVVYGARSRYLPVGRRLARLLPHGRLSLVPGAGHFHPLLKPDAFARRVATFVAAVERVGVRSR